MNTMATASNTSPQDDGAVGSNAILIQKEEPGGGFFGRRSSLFRNVLSNMGDSAKALHQTSTRHATIVLLEREMKTRKEQFGVDLYPLMERYRSMGEQGGGETEPDIAEVFQNCVADIAKCLEQRKVLQSDLLKRSKPKALCYQSTADSTESEDSTTASSLESSPSSKSWLQQRMESRLQQAKDAMEKNQTVSRIRAQLTALDKEMAERQKKFGVDMFEMMAYMVDNYEPRDPQIRELFVATKNDIAGPLARSMQAEKEIHDVRTSGEILLSHAEIHSFIGSTPTSWAMLQVNTGIPEEECKLVAYRVSLELASGRQGEESVAATITKKQFERFRKEFIDDPKGSQEFFHRCVFAAFDEDGNGVLDKEEIDKFLETFYMTGSIFEGDDRLPDKETLKKVILERLDENGDGLFNFDEIRSLISGSAERGNLLH
jgi:hypothetical protein